MDGYSLGRQLKAFFGNELYLIALTGYGQARDREASRLAGFDAHLVKPVNMSELETALRGAASPARPAP